MGKPKPILYLTSYLDEQDVSVFVERMEADGYLVVMSVGPESLRLLSPSKMKRSDYRACVNAARKLLKDHER